MPLELTRLQDLEYRFDECSRIIADLDTALDQYLDYKDDIEELKHYMESGQWKADFEADERGEIPAYIKHGILSEDGLYDLLESVDIVLKRAKEILIEGKKA